MSRPKATFSAVANFVGQNAENAVAEARNSAVRVAADVERTFERVVLRKSRIVEGPMAQEEAEEEQGEVPFRDARRRDEHALPAPDMISNAISVVCHSTRSARCSGCHRGREEFPSGIRCPPLPHPALDGVPPHVIPSLDELHAAPATAALKWQPLAELPRASGAEHHH